MGALKAGFVTATQASIDGAKVRVLTLQNPDLPKIVELELVLARI